MTILFCMEIFLISLFFHSELSRSWTCENGMRIEEDWLCDGVFDCPDRSDESLEACPRRPCEENEFRCDSGSCIPSSLECNGEVDCNIGGVDDDSDETRNCEFFEDFGCDKEVNHLCLNGRCIPLGWVCDGMDDCDDNTDEQHCNNDCPPDHFTCEKKCLENRWVCDGESDCDNAEDELNCTKTNLPPPKKINSCNVDEFECGGRCVLVKKACDGNDDCAGGEDEDQQCVLEGCRSREDPSTWGYDNIFLCDQRCRQTVEGPKCFCLFGYRLDLDGKHCRPEEFLPVLIFAVDDDVRSVELQANPMTEQIMLENSQSKIGYFTYEVQTDSLLFADQQSNWVKMRNGAQEIVSLTKVKDIKGMALDWLTRNVYVIHKSLNIFGGLVLFSLITEIRVKANLYEIEISLDNPVAITVEPRKGKMFIIDQGNHTFSRLLMANMDGSDVSLLAAEQKRQMHGVAFDYVTDIVYWSEFNKDEARIELYSLKEYKKKTLLSSLHQDFVIVNPISLDVFGDKVYFSDNSTKEIWAVDSVSGKSRQFLNGRPEPLLKVALASELIALHVSHPLIQPTNYGNPCQFSSCSHLCVLRPGGSLCLCPESMFLAQDQTTCIQVNVDEFTDQMTMASHKSPKIPTSALPSKLINPTNAYSNFNTLPLKTNFSLTSTIFKISRKTRYLPVSIRTSTSQTILRLSKAFITFHSVSTTLATLTIPVVTTASSFSSDAATTTFSLSSDAATTTCSISSNAATTTCSISSNAATTTSSISSNASTTTVRPTTSTTSTTAVPTMVSTTSTIVSATTSTTFQSFQTASTTTTTSTEATISASTATTTLITTVSASTTWATYITKKPSLHFVNTSCSKPLLKMGVKLVTPYSRSNIKKGSKLTFSCLKGWFFRDFPSNANLTLTCTENGRWDLEMPVCNKYSCLNLDCGAKGRCVEVGRNFVACRCQNGSLSTAPCHSIKTLSSGTISAKGDSRSNKTATTVLVVIFFLVAFGLLAILVWYKRFRLRKPKYALVEKEACSPDSLDDPHSEKSNVSFVSGKRKDGFFNPNYSEVPKCRIRLTLPEHDHEDDSGVDQLSNSPSSADSPVSYKFLEKSNDFDLIDESVEKCAAVSVDLKTEMPRRNPLAGVRKSVMNAFNLSKSESLENIVTENE